MSSNQVQLGDKKVNKYQSGKKLLLHREFPSDETEAIHRSTWRLNGFIYQRFP
jgi:hypothetical protein